MGEWPAEAQLTLRAAVGQRPAWGDVQGCRCPEMTRELATPEPWDAAVG